MNRYTQPLLAAAVALGALALGAAYLTGFGGRGRPTELQPAPDSPPVSCPTCPAGRAQLAATVAAEAVEVHGLAALTPAQAVELDGKTALFRVSITSASADALSGRDRREVYEV